MGLLWPMLICGAGFASVVPTLPLMRGAAAPALPRTSGSGAITGCGGGLMTLLQAGMPASSKSGAIRRIIAQLAGPRVSRARDGVARRAAQPLARTESVPPDG